jgi:hypothetical protein
MMHFGAGGAFGHPREETKTTKFHCEKCDKYFEITHDAHVDLWTMIENIPRYHRETSPECEYDADKVRVTK